MATFRRVRLQDMPAAPSLSGDALFYTVMGGLDYRVTLDDLAASLNVSVVAGTGIDVDSDTVSIDTAVVPRLNAANLFTEDLSVTDGGDTITINGAKISSSAAVLFDFGDSPSFANYTVFAAGLKVSSGGLLVAAGGETITAGGLVITAGGETITAGGLTVSADGAKVTGDSTITGSLNVTTTATAATFSGSGASLTNLPATQLTGDVPAASLPVTSLVASRIKPSARVCMSSDLSGVYDNGASGVGATLTASSNGALPSLDGTTMAVGDRVLLVAQSPFLENGLYSITSLGSVSSKWVLTRDTSMDTTLEFMGSVVAVTAGSTHVGALFVNGNTSDPTVGTTSIIFRRIQSLSSSLTVIPATPNTPTTGVYRVTSSVDLYNVTTTFTQGQLVATGMDGVTSGEIRFRGNVGEDKMEVYVNGTFELGDCTFFRGGSIMSAIADSAEDLADVTNKLNQVLSVLRNANLIAST